MFRAGKQSADADGLSCRPHGDLSDDLKSQKERERIWKSPQHHLADPGLVSIDQHTIQAISDRQLIYSSTDIDTQNHGLALVQLLSTFADALLDSVSLDSTSFLRLQKNNGKTKPSDLQNLNWNMERHHRLP